MIKRIFKTISIILIVCVVLLIVGKWGPPLIIGNGISQFSGERRIFANYAYREALSYSDDVLWITAVRVTKVDLINIQRYPDCLIPGDTQLKSQYQAEVKIYGLWGISHKKYLVPCSGDLKLIPN